MCDRRNVELLLAYRANASSNDLAGKLIHEGSLEIKMTVVYYRFAFEGKKVLVCNGL